MLLAPASFVVQISRKSDGISPFLLYHIGSDNVREYGPGCPRTSVGGGMAVPFGLEGVSGETSKIKTYSFRIGLPIIAVERLAIPITDPFDPSSFCSQIKGTTRPREHAPYIRTCFFASGHDGARQVASLVAMMHFLPLAMPNGKALLDSTHLPIAVSCGLDEQWDNLTRLQIRGGASPGTSSIEPVNLWQVPHGSVIFGQAP